MDSESTNLFTFRQGPQAFQPVLIAESNNQLDSESEALRYAGSRLKQSEGDPEEAAEPKPADDAGGMDTEMNSEELRENM
jgi:hypothetical protein